MKNRIFFLFLVLLFFPFSAMSEENQEVGETNQNFNEIDLPNSYFIPVAIPETEQSTTEGPDGPPAPINDWITVFLW